jgi:hypothetical protein
METGKYLQVAIGTQPLGNLLAGHHNRVFSVTSLNYKLYPNNKTHHILLYVNAVFANDLGK